MKRQESHGLGFTYINSRKTELIEHDYQQTDVYRPCAIYASRNMLNKTRKRLPTKWFNVGTDWRLVKGFDINYLTIIFMSGQRQRRGVISVLSQSR